MTMTKRKKLLFTALGAALLVVLSVSLTLAYLTNSHTVKNSLGMMTLKVKVYEDNWTSGVAKDIQAGGAQIAKDPYVKNEDSLDCYVRVRITVSGAKQYGSNVAEFLELIGLDTSVWKPAPGSDLASGELVVYYQSVLAAGQSTPKVFTAVKLNEQNAAGTSVLLPIPDSGFDIDVAAEAVQAKVEGVTFASPEEAFAQMWP